MRMFHFYLIVGGMPAAVQKYLDTNNLRDVYREQRGIIRTYKKDITQYNKEHKLEIEEIYDLIPSELNAKNKRFILKKLNEKARFNSKKQGELDFVVEYDSQVLPIEVKSGKDYNRHNALANVTGNEDYAFPQAFVFCQENVFTKQNIIYYPIYLIAFFEQINVEDATFKFDLTGLRG